ncbi:hypothetical protein EVAR_102246_1 [Eumeta japonica]|uniref:Uncharacterized protein n=1 Tax=Eumeta variegata TaxID=151549 RepID=A0A4C1WE16_EUMVA|nr:hypothetical protein EVAR_102246_1 [Eumeta japonica]
MNVTKTKYMVFALKYNALPNSRTIFAHSCGEAPSPSNCGCSVLEKIDSTSVAFHDETPSVVTVYNWFNELKVVTLNSLNHDTDLTDGLREGRSSTATTDDEIIAVWLMIETDKRVAC